MKKTTTNSTTEDDIRDISLNRLLLETAIKNLWAKGSSPRQIAYETRQPIQTIYELLRSQERAITEEEGVIHHGKKKDT